MRRTHASFPQDGQEWRAVGYGKIVSNPNVPSEHHIDLLLSRKRQDLEAGDAKNLFRVAKVGVGALPATHLGSVWLDGKIVGNRRDLVVRTGTVHFPAQKPSFYNAWHRDDDELPLIPAWCNPIPGEAFDSPHVVLPASGAFGKKIIVPAGEIARAWFFRSTKLTLTLMSDPIDQAIRNILDLNVHGKPGENPFCLREGFSDADVVVAAALQYSKLFRDRAADLTNRLILARRQNRTAYLAVAPPIVGDRTVKALGILIKQGKQTSFLALQLLTVPAPAFDVPTESIVQYHREPIELGEPGSNPTGGNSRGYHYVSPPKPNPDAGLGSGAEPNTRKPPRFIDPTLADFEDAPVFEVYIPPPKIVPGGIKGSTSKDQPPNEYSTGAGSSSGTTGPMRFRKSADVEAAAESQRKVEPAMPATFDKVEEVIPLLIAAGMKVFTLGNRQRFEGHAPAVRYLLSYGSDGSTWVCIGDRFRQLLVLEIEYQGAYFYLLDIERRPQETGYTLFFVARGQSGQGPFTRLDTIELDQLILDSCVNEKGRWKADEVGFASSKLKHSHSQPGQLLEKLKVKMREFRNLTSAVDKPAVEEVAATPLRSVS